MLQEFLISGMIIEVPKQINWLGIIFEDNFWAMQVRYMYKIGMHEVIFKVEPEYMRLVHVLFKRMTLEWTWIHLILE